MIPENRNYEHEQTQKMQTFTLIHVGISLVAIVSGLIVLYGLLTGKLLGGWTALFLATTTLTSVTDFPLPPFGWDPVRVLGTILLVLLGAAVLALYIFHLAGAWRPIYVVAAVTSLYLNCFVGVVQAFQKVSALHALAPTQSEPPFLRMDPHRRISCRSKLFDRLPGFAPVRRLEHACAGGPQEDIERRQG